MSTKVIDEQLHRIFREQSSPRMHDLNGSTQLRVPVVCVCDVRTSSDCDVRTCMVLVIVLGMHLA